MKYMVGALLVIVGAMAFVLFKREVKTTLPSFTQEQITEVENSIRWKYQAKLNGSKGGGIIKEIHMMKVSDKMLDGFIIVTNTDPDVIRFIGPERTVSCKATMAADSNQYMWECGAN